MSKVHAWASCLLVVVAAGRAYGQPVHHQPLTVGSRAMGLAGAYTAIADDASAAFHNPAGLPSPRRARFSGGILFFTRDVHTLRDGLVVPSGNADLRTSSIDRIGSFSAATAGLGSEDEEGLHTHTVAASWFTPYSNDLETSAALQAEDTGLTTQARIVDEQASQWFGLSYAYRRSDRLQLGMSLFVTRSSRDHEEIFGGAGAADSSQSSFTSISQSSILSLRAWHLAARLGGLFRVRPKWHVGLMLQPPGLLVRSKASLRYQRLATDNTTSPATGDFAYFESDDLDASLPIPWTVRVGVAYRPISQMTISADVGLVGPTSASPILSDSGALPQPLTQMAPFVEPTQDRSLTINGALGIRARVTEHLSWSVGGLSDMSSAPPIEADVDSYMLSRIHRLGFATAIGFEVGPVDMSLSFAALFGRGHGVGFAVDELDQPGSFQRSTATSRTFFLQLTGAARTASNIAKMSARAIVGEDDEEASDEPDPREADQI